MAIRMQLKDGSTQCWREGNAAEFPMWSTAHWGKEREVKGLNDILIKKPRYCQKVNQKPRSI